MFLFSSVEMKMSENVITMTKHNFNLSFVFIPIKECIVVLVFVTSFKSIEKQHIRKRESQTT